MTGPGSLHITKTNPKKYPVDSLVRQKFIEIFGPLSKQLSLHNLQIIAERFALVPYENITKIIRSCQIADPVKRLRMPENILEDHKLWRTGGTCFSLTYCLRTILESSGYRCSIRMADLGSGKNNHCVLIAVVDNSSYLIDPGYLITTPLQIPESGSVIHPTRLAPVRLEKSPMDESFYMSTLESTGEKYRYRMHSESCSEKEFMWFWIDSFSWNMMHSLLITKATPHGRFYQHDRHLRYINQDGKYHQKIKENFDQITAKHSGIDINLIRKAREYLSKSKPKLKGN